MQRTSAPVATSPVARLGHRPALDGLRGIAIALVVLVHSGNSLWPEAKAWLAQGGPLGVHLFFVLSGFLITTMLLGEHGTTGRIHLRRFAVRRARRLVPALVAVLAGLGVVAALGDRLRVETVISSAVYIFTATANAMMLGFIFPGLNEVTGGGGIVPELMHTWSLAIEVQFYVLWALALWALTRLRVPLAWMAALTAAVVVALAVARYLALANGTTWLDLYFSTWSRLDAPLVGSLAGMAFVGGWCERVPRRLLVALGGAGLAGLLATAFLTDWTLQALPKGLYTLLALGAAVTVLAVVIAGDTRLAGVLSFAPLVWLGTVSYSLYVWHYGIFFTIERRDPSWPGPVRLLVGVAVALVVSAASYYLVERPFLRRRGRSGRRRGAVPAPGTGDDADTPDMPDTPGTSDAAGPAAGPAPAPTGAPTAG